jgi:hypothetical protein
MRIRIRNTAVNTSKTSDPSDPYFICFPSGSSHGSETRVGIYVSMGGGVVQKTGRALDREY